VEKHNRTEQLHNRLKKKKKKKKLGINLTKVVKDLYNENYRTLKKETEEDFPCLWIGRINNVKMTAENNIQSQCNPNVIFHRNRKINLKIYLKAQKTLNNQSNLKKKAATLKVFRNKKNPHILSSRKIN
jgi:hypothetical protein